VQKGDMSISQAMDDVAAGLTGSALFGLGAFLFAQGLVTGAQGDSEDDKWSELLGHQGYALELEDGTSITLDWLAPESLPFFMGVETMSAVGENGWDASSIVNSVLESAKAAANPMLELSMMQGVSDLIESVQYAEGNPIPGIIGSMLASYFSQGIPTLLGQAERSGENVRMTTYADKNRLFPDLQYTLGRASSRLPGLDYQQVPYIDAWGREEESGDLGWRIFSNTLSPAYVSQVEVDKVEAELQRVRDATGDTGVFPDRASRSIEFNSEKHDLTAEQYTRYAKEKGQNSYRLAQAAMSSEAYKAMGDGEKAEYIAKMYGYADYKAKRAVFPEYTNSQYEKYEKAEAAGMTPDAYYAMTQTYDYDGSNAAGQPTKEEAKRYLDMETDLSRRQKADLLVIINKSWEKNNPYKS